MTTTVAARAREEIPPSEVVTALVEHGLIASEEASSPDLEISALSRRNVNVRVLLPDGRGFLVKQPDPLRRGGAKTLANELRFYELCRGKPWASVLDQILVTAHALRGSPPLLAVAWQRDARSPWRECRARWPKRFPHELYAELGSSLAIVHEVFAGRESGRGAFAGSGEADDAALSDFPSRPATFLSVHRFGQGRRRRAGRARLDLLRRIEDDPAVARELDHARGSWCRETLLHGDVRAGNVLVLPVSSPGGSRLRLVDWEMVKWGDPAWDLGCALADLVHLWVSGIPTRPERATTPRSERARLPLDAIRPAFPALWEAYVSRRPPRRGPPRGEGLLLRSVRCSGGRLVQAAWQRCAGADSLGARELELLRLAADVLRDPAAALRDLYGLGRFGS